MHCNLLSMWNSCAGGKKLAVIGICSSGKTLLLWLHLKCYNLASQPKHSWLIFIFRWGKCTDFITHLQGWYYLHNLLYGSITWYESLWYGHFVCLRVHLPSVCDNVPWNIFPHFMPCFNVEIKAFIKQNMFFSHPQIVWWSERFNLYVFSLNTDGTLQFVWKEIIKRKYSLDS